jgi:hypothetical protein
MACARDETLDRLRDQALVEPAGTESIALLPLVILIDSARALSGLAERLARDVADLRRLVADRRLPSAVRNLI